jgi:hypothetical protein
MLTDREFNPIYGQVRRDDCRSATTWPAPISRAIRFQHQKWIPLRYRAERQRDGVGKAQRLSFRVGGVEPFGADARPDSVEAVLPLLPMLTGME